MNRINPLVKFIPIYLLLILLIDVSCITNNRVSPHPQSISRVGKKDSLKGSYSTPSIWDNELWEVDSIPVPHNFEKFDAAAGISKYNNFLFVLGGNGTSWDNTNKKWELWEGGNVIEKVSFAVTPSMKEYFPYYTTSGLQDWCYYWPQGLWIDSSTGYFYSIAYAEYNFMNGWMSEAKERRLGTMLSTDLGRTWTYQGDILTQDKSIPPPLGQEYNGVGDTHLFISPDGYAYLFYKSGFYDKRTLKRKKTEIFVARCAIKDKLAPGKWEKFFNGKWNESGIGGHASVIMSPSNNVTVFFNKHLKKYVMIGSARDEKDFDSIHSYISFATNLTKQDWKDKDFSFPDILGWYNWQFDSELSSENIIGQSFRLYTSGIKEGKRFGYYYNVRFK